MAKIITLAQGGGGVGKTTLAASVVTELAQRGKRVLAFDCDAQSQLGGFLGGKSGNAMKRWLNSIEYKRGIRGDDSIDFDPIDRYTTSLRFGLDLVASDEGLKNIAAKLDSQLPITIMRSILPVIGEQFGYDYIVVDAKPGDALAEMMWLAADTILVPAPVVSVDMAKLENFITLLSTTFAVARIEQLPRRIVVANKLDARFVESANNWADLKESLEGSDWEVFSQPLPATAIISKAFAEHVSPMEYESSLDTAVRFKIAVRALVDEVTK